MSNTSKKEVLKIYEILPGGDSKLSAYINTGGLITELSNTYSATTEWIIFGSTEKFPTDVGDTVSDTIQGDIGENVQLLQEYQRNGEVYIVERDSTGPFITKDNTKYYITTNADSVQGSPIYTFRVNPTHLTMEKNKLQTKIRTKGGFAFQHWGSDIAEISLEGTTGNITPQGVSFKQTSVPGVGTIVLPHNNTTDIPTASNSDALAALENLQKIYDDDQNESAVNKKRRLCLEYRGKIYVGHFSKFSKEEIGEKPLQLYYKFTFMVHYEATDFSSANAAATTAIQRNASTIEILKSIKTATNTNSAEES